MCHFGEKPSILKGFLQAAGGGVKQTVMLKYRPVLGWGGRQPPGHVSGTPFGASIKKYTMLTAILFLAGLVCFYVFYKSIDYFEKI